FDDLLHALLIVSANDAAVAIAEKLGGDLAGFDRLMAATAKHIGLADRPVLLDPAGLDDEFSYEGGNRISARDMAIVTRAALGYRSAAGLLDRGFPTPVAAETRLDHLPAVVLARAVVPVPSPATTPRRHTHVAARPVGTSTSALAPIVLLVVGGAPAIAVL